MPNPIETLKVETLKVVDLLKTDGQGLADFAEKIEKRMGKIPILVHPFFAEETPADHPLTLLRKRPGYVTGRDRFISACLQNAIPLIIFEQESEYHLLPTRIRQASGTLYTVITGERTPLPKEGNQGVRAWDKLIAILRLAHVERVQVGGQYLFLFNSLIVADGKNITYANLPCVPEPISQIFQWRTSDELNAATGCVGMLAKRLACENFIVSFSPISSPR